MRLQLTLISFNVLIWQWFPSLLLTFIARKFGAKKTFSIQQKGSIQKNYQTTITNWIQQTIGGAYKEVLYLFDDGKIQDWNINLPTKCDLHFSISDYCIETRRKSIYKIDWLNDSKFAPFDIWLKLRRYMLISSL